MTDVIHQPAAGAANQASAPTVMPDGAPVRGALHISQGVVAKVAAQAASELPDVGGASRGLARMPGGDLLGGGPDLNRRPKATAHVDGNQAYLDVVVSVRWPASVPQVAAALRHHLYERVQQLTGLEIGAVNIEVAELVADTAPVARVH